METQVTEHIRQRINVSQTAKGLHQIEVTYERVSLNGVNATQLAEETLFLIKEVEKKIKDDKRKLVTDEA